MLLFSMLNSLGKKLTALIAGVITSGFLLVLTFYAYQHEQDLLRQNEHTLHQVTESVVHGLESVMLAGHAELAELYAVRLKKIEGITDFRVLRTNGQEAFLNNATIFKVNAEHGGNDFLPRQREQQVLVIGPDNPYLAKLLAERRVVYYYESVANSKTLTFLWPIVNGKDCHECHGKGGELRGLLKLSTSMEAVEREVKRTWWQAGVIMFVALFVVVLATAVLLRYSVVLPIKNLSKAMLRVSGGDFSLGVPVLGRSELAQMASSFNCLLQALRKIRMGYSMQHDKLEIIILSSLDGIVVTNDRAEIVLVNPAAELLLAKSSERITSDGFDALVDRPELIERLLAKAGTQTETISYNHHFLALSVVAIRTEGGRLIGQAALIRDITQEKRLEEVLRSLSNTDGLTGLHNRRMLNESLRTEVERAIGNQRALSILMFDIDHFKKFNDQNGHAQGDRVLKAVAETAQQAIRNVDMACRYGGEEFLLILTETPQEGALILAERLREMVAILRVDHLQITISIGVASFHDCLPDSADAFIQCADRALYAAKRAGRNQVCLFERGSVDASF